MNRTDYELPAGATMTVTVWPDGEQAVEGAVDGVAVLSVGVLPGESLADARPRVYNVDRPTTTTTRALGELLLAVADFCERGRVPARASKLAPRQ